MNWRPEGWQEIIRAILPLRMESLDPMPFNLIEVGADAILDKLKDYDNAVYIDEAGVDGWITLRRPLSKGWLVFIPEMDV